MDKIIRLDINDFEKCSNIWNMNENEKLKDTLYKELLNNERVTFVYVKDDEYIAEVSIVFDKGDEDYTIKGKRLYVSRMIVKEELRGNGYSKILMNFIIDYAKRNKYEELSIGVNIDNYIALKLYVELGFTKIQFIGEDSDGKFFKLIKSLK